MTKRGNNYIRYRHPKRLSSPRSIWQKTLKNKVVALFLAGVGTVLLFVEPDSYFYLFCYITAFLLFFARSNWMTPDAGKVYGRAKNIYYNRK